MSGHRTKPDRQTGNERTIRRYRSEDRDAVVALWNACGLVVPWNDPAADIALCRASAESELFVSERDARLAATVMTGQDGHRGWMYYLAVDPALRRRRIGRDMVRHAEAWLAARGVPKLQLMIRTENLDVRDFYRRLGYEDNPCLVMQRWLNEDADFCPSPQGD